MEWSRKNYKWFYDHIHSHYYALLIKWCFLPFGGEDKFRKELIAHIDFSPKDKIAEYFKLCGASVAANPLSVERKKTAPAEEPIRYILFQQGG